MAEKLFRGAPFGYQSTRFSVSGIHPQRKRPGTYTQVSYCSKATSELERRLGPGTYDAAPGDFSTSVLQRKSSTPGWKRAEYIERQMKMPSLLYKETWERNQLLRQNMGPGRYNSKTFVDLMKEKPSSVLGVCEARDTRFKETKSCVPGPGAYGYPHAALEQRTTKSASTKGLMDSQSRKFNSLPSTSYDLGPGTYDIKSSIDEILEHRASKRGPIDLFSAERDQPIRYGHFATPKNIGSEPGIYKISSFIEELENKHQKKHGVFSTMPRYLEIQSDNPGPGHYNTEFHFPKSQCAAPFLTSAKRFDKKSCRLLFGHNNPVGVGRYNLTRSLLDIYNLSPSQRDTKRSSKR
ncbi:ciliary microtubule-associated protein 2 isoform 2-T2 [Rhinophrynus dorsalis]